MFKNCTVSKPNMYP